MRVCGLNHFSRFWLLGTLWAVARQAPLSMGFSRQEYWSGLPCPPPGNLPIQEIEPKSLRYPALAGRFFTTSPTWEAQNIHTYWIIWGCQRMRDNWCIPCYCRRRIFWSAHTLCWPHDNYSYIATKPLADSSCHSCGCLTPGSELPSAGRTGMGFLSP